MESEETVQHLATQIVSFLHALHHLPVADLAALELPLAHTHSWWKRSFALLRAELLPQLPQEQRQCIEEDMERLLGQVENFTMVPRLIHGSFGPRAILYDARQRMVSGIIDFRQSAQSSRSSASAASG